MRSSKKIDFKSIVLHSSMLRLTYRHALGLGYLILLLVPYLIAQSLDLKFENIYRVMLSAATVIAMTAFFVQFPLAGRIKQVPLFANIDWGIAKHKKMGKYLGIFFFCHPLLIIAPKMLLSFDDFSAAFMSMLTSEKLLTGLIAWAAMGIWVLSAIFKDKLNMRYETWRLLHLVGFIIIITLATLHITSVGSHGQLNSLYNLLWWTLYLIVMFVFVYNYLIKPTTIKGKPFAVSAIKKISECDWQLCIESKSDQKFDFEAGQFAWINTSDSAYNLEQHPFSIAVEENSQSQLSFIIRELGDYTSSLGDLTLGQTVFVDGPYGSMSLAHSKHAAGITLIAGGVGIAPMLSLLKQLAKENDPRPIRLLYANKNMARMVCLVELMKLEQQMVDFRLQLFTDQPEVTSATLTPYLQSGFITADALDGTIVAADKADWEVYLCGPQGMMEATTKNLKQIGIAASHIHFEQLSY